MVERLNPKHQMEKLDSLLELIIKNKGKIVKRFLDKEIEHNTKMYQYNTSDGETIFLQFQKTNIKGDKHGIKVL